MRCVFAGTPEPAAVALAAVLASSHDVVAVITRPDAPAGRGRRSARSPVAELAADAGIEVLQPASARAPELAARLRELDPDCAPVVAYGALIPADLLTVPRLGWVNAHFSLLPAWRGAAPVQRAIWHGDDVTGVTTFALDVGMDTGPVYGTSTRAIGPHDTAGDLLGVLAHDGAALLVATLDALASGVAVAVPQAGEPSLAPKIEVDDARVRWDRPALAVDRQVRACTPAPGAWTTWRATRLRLGPVTVVDAAAGPDTPALTPGALSVRREAVHVGTATVPVRLGTVQAAGGRAMPAADWARGARPTDDDVLQ